METLQELRQKPHLSASSISDYADCGLAYKFSRIDNLERESRPAAMLLGSCIHKVLERFYQSKQKGHDPSIEACLAHFEELWLETLKDQEDIQFKPDETAETMLDLGLILLALYCHEIPEDGFKVLGTEIPFSLRVESVDVPVIGVMDLILEDDSGTVIIVDHKTISRSYSQTEIDQSLQLTLYHMAAKQNGFEDREILLRFDCMIKTKTPKFKQFYTSRTEEDIRKTQTRIKQTWNAIQHEVFVPAMPTNWKCSCCAFQDACGQFLMTG